jgi:type VI secretion system protein ImpK
LDRASRPLREALAAWVPPVRVINLAEQLPPPLPQLLSEGWLKAYKHPLGWLLVFSSDGAFSSGKAKVAEAFEPNLQRLARAFAPWPGELEVIGHTDQQPIRASRFASNLALSQARAAEVARYLQEQQGARRIEWSGKGDSDPVDASSSPGAMSRNRRVDVLWKVLSPSSAQLASDSASRLATPALGPSSNP